MAPPTSTRDRILREATRLFAEQGVKATTVAQIEGAVGLRPGSGGVHRHFPTKDDLVRAVLDAQLDAAQRTAPTADEWPRPTAGDVAGYLTAIGRVALEQIDGNREIALIMLRDAHNLPPGVLDEHHRRNFELSYVATADAFRELFDADDGRVDPDALAYFFLAPLVYFRVIEWATGDRVLDLADDRLLMTWTTLFEPLFASIAMTSQRSDKPLAFGRTIEPAPWAGVRGAP